MADDRPIGMFDSGFGGLTVARALIDLMPHEQLVYFGDTGRYPYGPRDLDEVRGFAHQITEMLVERFGVKLVVVACNTASAAALEGLHEAHGVPVVGVIEPGVEALAKATRTGQVGVIGTVGTIDSGSYQRLMSHLAPGLDLTCAACPGFVEFVERGETDSYQVHVLAERLLAPVIDAKVDSLLLGCTHYPFLARTISDVMGPDVVLVSSADETAFVVRAKLLAEGTARALSDLAPQRRFVSSGDVAWFAELGRRLLGPELEDVEGLGLVSAITVTILGSSGSYASPGQACTGYLVQSEGTNVLLDLGPGVLANLQAHLPIEQLHAVVATHCHPDHWVELPVMRNVCQWFIERPMLPVYSTAEVRNMSRTITGDDSEVFDWHVVTGGMELDIGGQRWRFSITDHPVETLAVRVDADGRSFAFTSDTGPRWSVGALGEGVDLVLSEASYTAEREPENIQHLSARQAGMLARNAGAGALVLTHQMPGADIEAHRAEGSEAFGADVAVAAPHAIFQI